MQLEIITPDATVYQGEVESAKFPGSNGSFQVLKDHAPLISSLAKGELSYKDADGEHNIIVDGGTVEVLNNQIIVLAESVIEEGQ
ncbi:ATP synthase F1 subunit epsilon [Fulvivirgaceae bacterium BMA10]|uniref:ATP synthase F1 subunit epsilon n=1 Tax=Splendidivirga corallicola TaxID=3051826 RepID=A0ABT8KIK2_9BACT|nr:ATP synthase F1 subunit epsilon [Fulvivirgaceae bacterium BMA10]